MDAGWKCWRLGLGVFVCCTLFVVGPACEKSPEQKLRRAKVLLTQETSLETAKSKLESVLDKQPDNIEAKRLMAKLYRLRGDRGDYARAEKLLDELWEKHDFGDEDKERSGRLRNARELIRSEYVELYEAWANEIDPKNKPDKYVEVLNRGLEFSENDTNVDLSMQLAKFYWRRGQKLVEEGNKREAAEAFSKIRQLRTMRGWDKREKARKRARELRLEFFKKKARKRFEEKGVKLVEEFDGFELTDDGETIAIDMTQNVDRGLDPDKEADRQEAKKMAFVGLVAKLRKLAVAVADLPDGADLGIIGTDRAEKILLKQLEFEEDEMRFRLGRYHIKGELPVEGAIRMAYDVKTAYEEAKAAEEAEEASAPSGDADAGAAGGSGADASEEGGETGP